MPFTPLLPLALTLLAQAGPSYRYEQVPPVKPGTALYAAREDGGEVYCAADLLAHREALVSVEARDVKGVEDLVAAGRLFLLPTGTAIKVLQYRDRDTGLVTTPSYEVRVLDGKHRDKKGWVFAGWAKRRVEAGDAPKAAPAPKAKARRKRR